MPAFLLVTPKGNYFPMDREVKLGDENNNDKIFNDYILDFVKGRLSLPERDDERRF